MISSPYSSPLVVSPPPSQVFIPKQFLSARDAFCVRCAIKANEGLLYPLAKALLFIHKPTVLVKFEDIEQIEFRRYEP
ncbi:hypothetical protein EON64_13040, partial [archaeon]